MGIQIHELAQKTGNLSSSDYFVTDNGSVTTKIDYTKLAKAILRTEPLDFIYYDDRCEDFSTSDKTSVYRVGNMGFVSFQAKVVKAMTSSQNSVATITDTSARPSGTVAGVFYNRTKSKAYWAQVAPTGNVNIMHGGDIAVGDQIVGQICWVI